MEGGSSSLPSWIELPRDLTENILSRLGQVEILRNAQRVCTTWRSVCSEPSLWRVIDIYCYYPGLSYDTRHRICRHAVDRSKGELIDINIEFFCTDDLLHYISERSSRLKCLRLTFCESISGESLTTSVKKFPELEELHLFFMPFITAKVIEAISISCPNLKSFTFNQHHNWPGLLEIDDSYALTIAKNMPNLRHLCLVGNKLTNEGLKAIFNGCPNLESLDLRQCFSLDLQGDFGKICSGRIKYLKRPSDSISINELGNIDLDDED
ncbi:hypothetical protein CASFOL_014515 [Castilleja foliolosa]|uniref:F-box domain-containing protein n=1 Tax=Castilleja foliolosa TaxID=1961234 RepID=A0ABD3DN68_9LAMI